MEVFNTTQKHLRRAIDLVGGQSLINAGVDDLQRVATSSFMLFQPRGNQSQLIEMVKSKGTGIPRIAYLLSTLNNKGDA